MNEIVFAKLKNASKIIIGLSGGADSIALTHILFTAFGTQRLLAAHVNHGIRGAEGDRDERFVADFCESRNISLEICHEDIPQKAKALHLGLEECGRQCRYEFFQSLCTDDRAVIATAHQADDNAETVLLNLVRGTGLHGLCGIPPIRDNIVRPLLSLSRKEIEDYCSANNLHYITDGTNAKNNYARNKLRNLVIPTLKEINVAATENINHSAQIVADAVEYLEIETQQLLEKSDLGYGLSTAVLSTKPDFLIRETISRYLKSKGYMGAEGTHLRKICTAVRESGRVIIPGGMQITVKQGILTVVSAKRQHLSTQILQFETENFFGGKKLLIKKEKADKNLKINNLLFKNCIDCAKIKTVLTVGSRISGEKVTLAGRKTNKTLKKLFNECQIPADLREAVAIIRDGADIVFIEGIGVSEGYQISKITEEFLFVKITQEER